MGNGVMSSDSPAQNGGGEGGGESDKHERITKVYL